MVVDKYCTKWRSFQSHLRMLQVLSKPSDKDTTQWSGCLLISSYVSTVDYALRPIVWPMGLWLKELYFCGHNVDVTRIYRRKPLSPIVHVQFCLSGCSSATVFPFGLALSVDKPHKCDPYETLFSSVCWRRIQSLYSYVRPNAVRKKELDSRCAADEHRLDKAKIKLPLEMIGK